MLKRISILAFVLVMMLSVFSTMCFAEEFDPITTDDCIADIAPDMDIMTAPKVTEDAVKVVTPISPVEENSKNMQFEPMAFVDNLNIMGVGMLGIFIVIGAIIVSVFVLNKFTSPKAQKKDEE